MSKSSHLMAAVYPDRDHAQTILDMLERMHRAVTITLTDAALVTKDDEGKIRVEETKDLTTRKGARRGALIAGTFGLIFPPSLIVSAFAGGAIGAVAARFHDSGIKNKEMHELADRLEPGKAAVIVLAAEDSVELVQDSLSEYEGTLVITAIDEETLDALDKEHAMQAGSGD
jgi:uncharacterized membrane protein